MRKSREMAFAVLKILKCVRERIPLDPLKNTIMY